MVRSLVALSVGVTLLVTLSVHSSTASAPEASPEATEVVGSWRPPAMEGDTYDWLQLGTGEWLRGDIERMRDEQLEFDSRRLKMLTIKWKHIDGIYTSTPHRWVLEDGTLLIGPAIMASGILTVQTVHGIQMAAQDLVIAILPGEGIERDRWTLDISLGLTSIFGSSPQLSTSTLATIVRESARNRLYLNYQGAFGRARDVLTVNNHWASARFDWYVTRNFFLKLIQGTVGHDNFRNLGLQFTVGSGVGYTFIDTATVEWSIDLSGAYVYTAYQSVEAGASSSESGSAVIPSTKLDIEITDDIDWGATHRSTLVVSNFDLTTYRTTSYLEIELTDIFDLNVNFSWDRDRHPVPLEDGTLPKQDTFQLITGFGISL